MEQIARNLTDHEDGFLNGKLFLIMDRDAKFSPRFKSVLSGYGIERSHQGIGNVLINGAQTQNEGTVEARERLGGLLKYYHRRAA